MLTSTTVWETSFLYKNIIVLWQKLNVINVIHEWCFTLEYYKLNNFGKNNG